MNYDDFSDDIKAKHMIAEFINSHPDPQARLKLHEYQNRLNGMLESLEPADRVAVIVSLMRENQDTIEELINEIKGEIHGLE